MYCEVNNERTLCTGPGRLGSRRIYLDDFIFLVFTFLIIIFKLTIPFICTIPFYAEIMTFALTLSCYDPANDTNYVGSNKLAN